MKKIKVSIVSYLNTLPFIYGLEEHQEFLNEIELHKDIPSECARKLIEGEVDIGLVPVAVIPKIKEATIHTNYCIGAVGKVKSVLLLSEVPLEEIKTIYLDYQSRTSVKLCQLLCLKYWEIDVEFKPTKAGYESKIGGNTAAVIIGDRTFQLEKEYPFQYDLAEEWMKWKNLPFVFAAWVSNKHIEDTFLEQFNAILAFGVKRIQDSINHFKLLDFPIQLQRDYLTNSISYVFNEDKKEALNLFLKEINSLKTVS